MLAVLKAGGAFVPLDPSHPIARLQSLVGEVEAEIILCSTIHSSRLASAADNVVAVDAEQLEKLTASKNERSPVSPSGTNAAYVLFTSGSTGKPKVRDAHVSNNRAI
jgi:non-ribosomal peptide synthetase component F